VFFLSKHLIFLIIFVALSIILAYPTFAVPFTSMVTPNVTNISVTNQFLNFSVNNTASGSFNVTQVNITLPTGFGFIAASNATTASNTTFYYVGNVVSWSNTTSTGFVQNGTTHYFSINASTPSNYLGIASFNVSTLNITTYSSTLVNVSVRGVIVNNFPASREFGNQTVSINCSAYSNNSLGNITIRISNLTYFNQTLNEWNTHVWNIVNVTNVTGLQNQTFNTTTLYGNYSDFYKYVFRCEANDTAGNLFSTSNISFIVSMRNFSGYVKDYTSANLNQANVSIYRFVEQQDGPPLETYVTSRLTGNDGNFSLTNVNTTRTCAAPDSTNVSPPMQCEPMFRIKIFYPNETNANQTGPTLPPFPRQMIFGSDQTYQCPPGAPPDMPCGPPKLNGSTIYTQNASVFRLYAKNFTNNSVNFGYEVSDQTLGFPIYSCIKCNVSSANVVVPTGRNYTVMMLRDPQMFQPPGGNWALCGNISQLACPVPPISTTVTDLTTGNITTINQSLVINQYNLWGCINISAGANNSAINITKIVPKLVPWAGFVPPMKADVGSGFNISDTDSLNYSDPRCPAGSLAFYNMSVMGSTSGINYFIEFYGKNASSDAGDPGNTFSVAAFQNFTIYNNTHPGSFNITLRRLAGTHQIGGDVNTSKVTINLFKNTGNKTACNAADTGATINCQALSKPHIEIDVKDSNIYNGQNVHYIIEELSNGSFKIPFLNTSTVKISIFDQGTSPTKKTLNLSQNVNNVTIYSFMPEKILPNGTKMEFNKTTEGMMQNIRFYRSGGSCDVYNPPESCALEGGNFSGAGFDPMRAMLAGKTNLRITTPNVTLYLINVDLLASGPPEPDRSESAMSETRTASSLSAAWRFGSMAPRIYDHVLIGVRDTTINSSWSYNISIPLLFGENISATPAWSLSAGGTLANVPEDYTDYNATGSAYRDFLTSTGMSCSFTNSTKECYIDNTNKYFWLKIPHFSGVQPTVTGSAPTAAAVTQVVTTGGGITPGANVTVRKTYSYANIEPGYPRNISEGLNASGTHLTEIYINVVNRALEVTITIEKSPQKPADVTVDVSGKVYEYINITKKNLDDTNIEKGKMKFKVERSWISSNNIDSSTIALYRYSGGTWNKLSTTKLSEDSDYAYYEAEVPGFSYFAISGETLAAIAPPICTENWSCPDWSECVNNKQTRTCTDLNACGTTVNKPAETQDCVSEAEVVGWPFWSTAAIVIVIIAIVCALFYTQRKKLAVLFKKKK